MRYDMEDLPGTERFIHKRLGAAVGGFLTGGPLGALSSFTGYGGGGTNGARAVANIQRPRRAPAVQYAPTAAAQDPCRWPQRMDPRTGQCRTFLGEMTGPDQPIFQQTVAHGRPVVAPGQRGITRLMCPRGYVLNTNDMCEWGLARNAKARKWRPGRKPMFTGGDLNAISRSAQLADSAEEIFKKTNPAKKAVSRSYRSSWRKPLKK